MDERDDEIAPPSILARTANSRNCAVNHQLAIETSAEALRLSQSARFDLYLLDSRLPDGTGAELCQRICSFDRVTPILFLSADASPQTQAEVFRLGAQAYLTKPVDPEVVKEMVRWLLDDQTARVGM